jgi:hypothetical protein
VFCHTVGTEVNLVPCVDQWQVSMTNIAPLTCRVEFWILPIPHEVRGCSRGFHKMPGAAISSQ